LAALFQSGIAICQYFSQEHLGLRLLSECREAPATFDIATGRLWLFDFFAKGAPVLKTLKRSAGTFPHCNALGGFLMLSILLSYSWLITLKRTWHRSFGVLLLVIQFFALATTYSRSAIFGLAIGSSIFLFWGWKTKTPCRFLVCAIAISALCSFGLLFEQYLYRGGVFNYSETAQNSDQIRLAAQQTAFQIIQDHPVTGVGFQQFSKAAQNYGNATGAHNIYLFLSSEMGLIACLAFIGFMGFILISSLSVPWTPQIASLFCGLIAFLFIGGCDFYPILFQQGKLMLFFTAALLLAEILRTKQRSIA
jgi:O-antigen ligase